MKCFRGLVFPILEYCSAVWCSAADTHLRLSDRLVSGASVLAVGVLGCNISHRRSVAVLCMLHKIRSYPMHPLYGALPVTFLSVRVTPGTLAGRSSVFSSTSSLKKWFHSTFTQYHRTFIPHSVSPYATILMTAWSTIWD